MMIALSLALTQSRVAVSTSGGGSAPTADFSQPANSQYLALLFEDF